MFEVCFVGFFQNFICFQGLACYDVQCPTHFTGLLDFFLADIAGLQSGKGLADRHLKWALHGLWRHLDHENVHASTQEEVAEFVQALNPNLKHFFPAKPCHELSAHAEGETAYEYAMDTNQAYLAMSGAIVVRLRVRHEAASHGSYTVQEVGLSYSWPTRELEGFKSHHDDDIIELHAGIVGRLGYRLIDYNSDQHFITCWNDHASMY